MIEGMTREDHRRADFWDAFTVGLLAGFLLGLLGFALIRVLGV